MHSCIIHVCCDLFFRHPVGFQSYFVAESDVEFSVSPQTGELKPLGTPGTLITVGFTPKLYGKTYHAKLVVQVRSSYIYPLSLLSHVLNCQGIQLYFYHEKVMLMVFFFIVINICIVNVSFLKGFISFIVPVL